MRSLFLRLTPTVLPETDTDATFRTCQPQAILPRMLRVFIVFPRITVSSIGPFAIVPIYSVLYLRFRFTQSLHVFLGFRLEAGQESCVSYCICHAQYDTHCFLKM